MISKRQRGPNPLPPGIEKVYVLHTENINVDINYYQNKCPSRKLYKNLMLW